MANMIFLQLYINMKNLYSIYLKILKTIFQIIKKFKIPFLD